jgi:hypothetical protein
MGIDALIGGLVGDDFVEPFAQAHAGPASGFLGGIARFPPDSPDAPSSGSVHFRNRNRNHKNRSATGPIWRRRRHVSARVVKKPLMMACTDVKNRSVPVS